MQLKKPDFYVIGSGKLVSVELSQKNVLNFLD